MKHLLHTFTYFVYTLVFLLFSCEKKIEKKVLLSANREAQLGWVNLKIYEDKSFEFISSGIREDVIYPGTVKISNDTLYFDYSGSIPKVGEIGIIKNNFITYIGGSYNESLQIKHNNLNE